MGESPSPIKNFEEADPNAVNAQGFSESGPPSFQKARLCARLALQTISRDATRSLRQRECQPFQPNLRTRAVVGKKAHAISVQRTAEPLTGLFPLPFIPHFPPWLAHPPWGGPVPQQADTPGWREDPAADASL